NFITRNYLGRSAQGRRNAAILLIRQLDRALDSLLRNGATTNDVLHEETCEGPRMFFATLAAHFDAVIRNLLPLLAQNRNDIDAGAASQSEQQQLHRRSRAVPLGICLNCLGVS